LDGQSPHYVTSYPGQLSLLPSAGWKISTSQSAVILHGLEVKAVMAHSNCGCTTGLSLVNTCHTWVRRRRVRRSI